MRSKGKEFPSRLLVRTLCLHCQGLGWILGWGTEIPQIGEGKDLKGKSGLGVEKRGPEVMER